MRSLQCGKLSCQVLSVARVSVAPEFFLLLLPPFDSARALLLPDLSRMLLSSARGMSNRAAAGSYAGGHCCEESWPCLKRVRSRPGSWPGHSWWLLFWAKGIPWLAKLKHGDLIRISGDGCMSLQPSRRRPSRGVLSECSSLPRAPQSTQWGDPAERIVTPPLGHVFGAK